MIKYLTFAALLCAAPLSASEVQLSIGAGGSMPYDGSGVSGSPSLKASGFVKPWPFLAMGLSVAHQTNHVADRSPVGSVAGVSGGQGFASGKKGGDTTNNTTVVNVYPPAVPAGAGPARTDTRIASALSLEPEIRLGSKIGIFWPYVMGSYGTDRITTQDGNTHYGNGYRYGAGVDVFFGGDSFGSYFVNIEAANKASESSVGVFRSVQAGVNVGVRFSN